MRWDLPGSCQTNDRDQQQGRAFLSVRRGKKGAEGRCTCPWVICDLIPMNIIIGELMSVRLRLKKGLGVTVDTGSLSKPAD